MKKPEDDIDGDLMLASFLGDTAGTASGLLAMKVMGSKPEPAAKEAFWKAARRHQATGKPLLMGWGQAGGSFSPSDGGVAVNGEDAAVILHEMGHGQATNPISKFRHKLKIGTGAKIGKALEQGSNMSGPIDMLKFFAKNPSEIGKKLLDSTVLAPIDEAVAWKNAYMAPEAKGIRWNMTKRAIPAYGSYLGKAVGTGALLAWLAKQGYDLTQDDKGA